MEARRVALITGASFGIGQASAILYALEQPEHVAVSEIMIRPVTQEL